MKHHLFPLVLLLMAVAAQGQNVHFSFTDGTQQSYALQDVRKTTFTEDVMNLHLTDGTVYSWDLSTLDYYTYDEGLVTSIGDAGNSILAPMKVYPNPTTGSLNVEYVLDSHVAVNLEIRDMQGRVVQRLELGMQTAGTHTARWDGRDSAGQTVAAGTYLCRISAPQMRMSRTFIIQ